MKRIGAKQGSCQLLCSPDACSVVKERKKKHGQHGGFETEEGEHTVLRLARAGSKSTEHGLPALLCDFTSIQAEEGPAFGTRDAKQSKKTNRTEEHGRWRSGPAQHPSGCDVKTTRAPGLPFRRHSFLLLARCAHTNVNHQSGVSGSWLPTCHAEMLAPTRHGKDVERTGSRPPKPKPKTEEGEGSSHAGRFVTGKGRSRVRNPRHQGMAIDAVAADAQASNSWLFPNSRLTSSRNNQETFLFLHLSLSVASRIITRVPEACARPSHGHAAPRSLVRRQ